MKVLHYIGVFILSASLFYMFIIYITEPKAIIKEGHVEIVPDRNYERVMIYNYSVNGMDTAHLIYDKNGDGSFTEEVIEFKEYLRSFGVFYDEEEAATE